MGLYEKIKDLATVVQKADNIELYNQLLDVGSQALDLQNELYALNKRVQELEMELASKKRVVRHKEGLYVTLENDDDIHYCSTCWGLLGKLIQMDDDERCLECERRWREADN